MKAIVYSLFGYERARVENCFDFNSYLRGFMLCLRSNRLLYPQWKTILEIDKASYEGFKPLFDGLIEKNACEFEINENGAKLCEAMLWRLKPIYHHAVGKWKYTHVLCRDLDSPATYREAQAVKVWVDNDKAMHAITDSISHGIPLLGGMIGFKPDYFSHMSGTNTFVDLMAKANINYSVKGSDQTFLNSVVYPIVAHKGSDSITQHYFKGYGKTWLSDFHTCNCWMEGVAIGHNEGCKENVKLDISDDMRESDKNCQHIGSSGWNTPTTEKFMYRHKEKFQDLIEVERLYPKIFTWNE